MFVATHGLTTNHDDHDGRDDQPERCENDRMEVGRECRHEHREHHDGDAESRDRLAGSGTHSYLFVGRQPGPVNLPVPSARADS